MRALSLTLVHILIMVLIACEEPRSCSSDEDCRDGFRCDLKVYVGECVEVVAVVRCGDQLCAAPEVCVRGEVCAIPEGGGSTGGSTAGAVAGEGPMGGDSGGVSAGAEVMSGEMIGAGAVAGGLGGGGAGESGGEVTGAGAMAGVMAGVIAGSSADLGMSDDMEVNPEGGDPFSRDQGGQSCESACDCSPGLTCVQGVCTSTNEPVYCCEEDEFCPPGEACEYRSGRLSLCAIAPCESACDCTSGLSCIQGRCELGDQPVFCCDEGSCPSGMACDTRRGVRSMCPSDSCDTACDCSAGQRCVNGVCRLEGDPIFCCESSSCPPGAVCQSMSGMPSVCESDDACSSACDCTPGMSCVNGRCALGESPMFCCGSDQCPIGERCEPMGGGRPSLCE